jgi:LPS export ABC transporter protein LptC
MPGISMSRLWPAVVAGLLLGAGCPEKGGAASEESLPDQVVEDFVLDQTSGGSRVFRLVASRATAFDAEGRVDVLSPRVAFYDEDGTEYSTMVADSGTIFSKTEDLVARGRVQIETRERTRLLTDSLVWSNRERVLRTDAAVFIDSPDGHIAGQGLVSDAGLSKIEIKSEVSGTADYQIGP